MSDPNKEKHHPRNSLLRQARHQRGWTQQQLADQLETSLVTIKRWERGSQSPGSYLRHALCKLFGLDEKALGLAQQEKEEDGDSLSQQKPLPSTSSAQEEGLSMRENEEIIIIPMTGLNDQRHANSPSFTWSSTREGDADSSRRFPFSKNAWPHGRWRTVIIIVVLLAGSIGIFSAFSPLMRASGPSTTPTITGRASGQTYQTSPIKISDSLDKQDPQSQWNTGKICTFQNGVYHAQSSGTNYCMENALILVDIEYQINVTLVKGPQAGIVFRGDGNSHLYYFSIDAQGHYEVDLLNAPTPPQQLLFANSSAFRQGYGLTNTLGVVIKGSAVSFLINQQTVASLKNIVFPYGHVGICVGSYLNDNAASQETIATYQNAIIQGQVLTSLS